MKAAKIAKDLLKLEGQEFKDFWKWMKAKMENEMSLDAVGTPSCSYPWVYSSSLKRCIRVVLDENDGLCEEGSHWNGFGCVADPIPSCPVDTVFNPDTGICE